jgi:polyhydroxybutyrate depolymerase
MKKIIGFLILMLLIINAIPVYGSFCESRNLSGKLSILPDTHLKFIFYNGKIRSYRIHIPSSYNGNNPVPLVFDFHGNPGHSINEMFETRFNKKADEEGFIVVYPNGHIDPKYIMFWMKELGVINRLIIGFRYWNFWDFINANVNDVGFIESLIEELQNNFNINSSRIYCTGMSGGGFMSYRLGAEMSDVLAAIAPVAGSIGGRSWIDYTIDPSEIPPYIIPEPKNPLPVIVFHGMEDIYVPYEGIEDEGSFFYLSVNESISFWVEHNECNLIPDVEVSDSGNIIKKTYSNSNQGCEVILYTVVDGGHEWFGGVFAQPCEISATDIIWDFFESHPKQKIFKSNPVIN